VGGGEEKGTTYKALVAAVRRSEIERYLTLLGKAGLSVEAIDLSVSSLVRLHHSVCGTTRNPVILAHIGHSMSLLTIATAQSITIQRIIDWGSGALLSRLSKEMDLVDDSQKAATILARYGLSLENDSKPDRTPDADTRAVKRVLYQILAPYLDEFVHEMDKAIGYARVEEGNPLFEAIYLYGHPSLTSALDAYVENRLNIKTQGIHPFEHLSLSDDRILADLPPDAPFCLALGYAMRRTAWL
jgi:Tfp pilus assembly PilM family ATPase